MKDWHIAFVAAGSGGHIQSALAVLEYMSTNEPELASRSIFVGSNLAMEGEVKKESLEERLCQRMNIPFVKIRGGKLQRQISFKTLLLLLGTFNGFLDAWQFFNKSNPKVVVAFGGYSSLPMGIVAWLRRRKFILHEQTTSIGLTNNILQRLANISAISYPQSQVFFKHAKQVVMTGSPSREYLFSIATYADLEKYLKEHTTPLSADKGYLEQLYNIEINQQKYPLIFLSGGSQGSHLLNENISQVMGELAKTNTVFIQTGENQVVKDFEALTARRATLNEELQSRIIIRKFIFEEMGYLYKHARLFIGRSGANTVYEAGMMGTPAILVPLPWVTKNEQYTNAQILEGLGQAVILEQAKLNPTTLKREIDKMLALPVQPVVNRDELFPKDAAKRITEEIKKLL